MHGVKRDKAAKTFEEKNEIRQKLAKFQALSKVLLSKKQKGVYDKKALGQTAMMLKRQPDFSTVWNYRRDILSNLLKEAKSGVICDALKSDLELVTYGLRHKNPKSYCLWHHRRWVLLEWIRTMPETSGDILRKELSLCKTFLKHDERNFHCWNYRRFVAKRCDLDVEKDLEFTQEKILENFSNYSALHQRMSVLKEISSKINKREEGTEEGGTKTTTVEEMRRATCHDLAKRLDEELETAQQAIFTEPDDQSSWLYIRWILEWGREFLDDDAIVSRVDTVLDSCRELVEMEGPLKWPLLTEYVLLRMRFGGRRKDSTATTDKEKRCEAILKSLVQVDPAHRGFYESAARGGT